jgi:DNA-binding LacI/PurR family transcriptional regulator
MDREAKKRPTMADVAEAAGVSVSTVSLVLNDKPGISAEVRTVVLKAVDELGYRVRRRYPQRVTPEVKTVAVVHYASPEAAYRFEVSGLFVDFVASIQDYFQYQKNVNWALIPDYREGDEGNLGFQLLKDEAVIPDGLILIGIITPQCSLLQRTMGDGIPVVVLSRYWPDLPVSTVSQDHCEQARTALDYLVQLGHRKIAFVAREIDQVYDWFSVRLACYREMMTELSGGVDEELIAVAANGAEAVKALMPRRSDVTAIFAVHDENAVEAMRGLREMGLRVPQDVSIMGLDDSAASPEGYPGLTTVGFSHAKVGQLAAEILLKQIEDEDLCYSKVLVRSRLIERGSCSKPRGAG